MESIASMMEDFNGSHHITALIVLAKTDGVTDVEREFIENQARDCICLARIDEDYSTAERSRVLKIASQLDVDRTVVEKLEGWLERYEALLEEVQVILEG